jgi:putative ABC transport system permease protein
MALGATRPQVIAMVLRNAAAMLGVGLAAGLTGAWYLGATATPFLFELDKHDPRAFAAAVLLLSVACLAATIVPARRAASVDPTLALRSE